jgi:putative transposase
MFLNILYTTLVLTYFVKLKFSSNNDERRLIDILKAERDVFNFCSNKHFGSKKNSIVELHEKSYHPFRDANPKVPSQIIIRGEKSCLAAYRSVKSNKHKITKPIKKKHLSVQLDKRLYVLKGNEIRVTSIDGKRIKCSFDSFAKLEELRALYSMGDPSIYVKDSQVWLSLVFKTPDFNLCDDKLIMGVDLGKRRLACTSDGRLISSKEFNREKRKIRFLKRELQSKGTKSSKRKLRKLRRKESNVSKHYVHHVVNEILKTNANVIAIEDLSSLKKPKKLSKTQKERFKNRNSISQVPFRIIRDTLVYKARTLNKEVETVNPYMTSQDDYRDINRGERKGCRYYASDGLVFDADVQASINVAKKSSYCRKGEHPISLIEPIDGSFKPCGQASVNRPNVFKSNLRVGLTSRKL